MNNSFYSIEELKQLGLKQYGNNVCISRKASFYGAESISFGDNVRVDDFCILSGRITIGNCVHIAAFSGLFGGDEGIIINDFANISSRVCVYALSDDFSGASMTNPMIPDFLKNVCQKRVVISKHVIIGTGSTVLPGVTVGEGAAIGAMSLVKNSVEGWTTYAGVPIKRIGIRNKKLLELEQEYLKYVRGSNS